MCVAVVHFTEIICCNTKITNVLIVFEDRIVSLQAKAIAGSDTLLKRNRYNPVIKHGNHGRPQSTLVEGAPLKECDSWR